MDERARTRLSKRLSYVLRHRPDSIGLVLDDAGWIAVDALLDALRADGLRVTRAEVHEVVATSPKQRFALSPDGARIRANQGHSVGVELGYAPATPPDQLFHGTVATVLDRIRASGLQRMQRHHVHLSPDLATATAVGQRRGRPVILVVRAFAMHQAGFSFYVSDNGVWLTEHVPVDYLVFPDAAGT